MSIHPRALLRALVAVDRLGFDPVDGGRLAIGKRLEPDGSPYAETFTAGTLAARLTGT
jgi:predicted dinucleotide-binding enzyme